MATTMHTGKCAAPVYKLAPFMQHSAPAANLYELLSPLWWVMEGKPLGSYPIGSFWPRLASYVSTNGKAPIAGVMALAALVLLSLLIFVLWRFVRCIRVVCCQQEAYADANKVLFSKRLRWSKVLLVGLSLTACGIGAWGMLSLNKNILPALNARIDSMQEFPAKVVQQVSSLANETAQLTQPLNNISSVISGVDVEGIRTDLVHVADFLHEAPNPTTLRVTLQRLNTALKPTLYESLRQLHAQVNVASETSQLVALKRYLDKLADFDISPMMPAIHSFSDAMRELYDVTVSDWSDKRVQTSPLFNNLRSSFEQIDLDAWVPYIEQAIATANAINAMRTPATNPFTAALRSLMTVDHTVKDIRGNLLTSLADTVKTFNGLWYNNASVAFQGLLDKAVHINGSVLELPNDVQSKFNLVNASLTDFMKLYQGKDSLLNLPEKITAAGAKLQMPDATSLISNLKVAEEQLNNAQGLTDLITKLSSLARALDKTLRGAKNNILPSLDAFAADENMRMDLQDTLTFEGPVVQGVAATFEAASLGDFKQPIKAVLSDLDAAIEPARHQVDAVPGVLQQIAEFNSITSYLGPLQQAEKVYREFGGNPDNLTKPVFDLLDRFAALGNEDLTDAEALVANVSSAVQKMSEVIQSAALDGVDQFQSHYLGMPANTSAQGSANNTSAQGSRNDRLVKAVHATYYAMLGAYAGIMVLIVLLCLATLLNCPAGVGFAGFLLNTGLVAFSLVPLVLTVSLLLMRDTCGHMEGITAKAVAMKAGNSSLPAAVSRYYLTGGVMPSGTAGSLPEVLKEVSAEYDIQGIRGKVNSTLIGILQDVVGQYQLRPEVTEVVDDVTDRISTLMGSMDSVLLTLEPSSVAGVYSYGKNFFCCSLTNQIYLQWAATLVMLVLAWAALQCALMVLATLDTLSENCCRIRRYRTKDYGSSGAPPASTTVIIGNRKALPNNESTGSETVAVISIGAAALAHNQHPSSAAKTDGNTANGASKLLESTPLPAPLKVMTTPPASHKMPPSRTTYPTVPLANQISSAGQPPASAEPQQQQQQQPQTQTQTQQQHQQQQRHRVGGSVPQRPPINITAVYPSVMPSLAPGSPTAGFQQQQQQQTWQTPGGMPGRGLLRAPCSRI